MILDRCMSTASSKAEYRGQKQAQTHFSQGDGPMGQEKTGPVPTDGQDPARTGQQVVREFPPTHRPFPGQSGNQQKNQRQQPVQQALVKITASQVRSPLDGSSSPKSLSLSRASSGSAARRGRG